MTKTRRKFSSARAAALKPITLTVLTGSRMFIIATLGVRVIRIGLRAGILQLIRRTLTEFFLMLRERECNGGSEIRSQP